MKATTVYQISSRVLVVFLTGVLAVCSWNAKNLFAPRYGRRHRIAGVAYIAWLIVGCHGLVGGRASSVSALWYDCVLGCLGVVLTLTAAYDFKGHDRVKNPVGHVSGTLSETATVSFSEMIEHSFYQGLNLAQALFLHSSYYLASKPSYVITDAPRTAAAHVALLALVTLPWLFRPLFPVNSFSANYDPSRRGGDPWSLIGIMYRTKKYQYMLYKHFLLHGLNVAVAATPVLWSLRLDCGGSSPLIDPASLIWRAYWLCLNASYVFEFFLQTLVRRGKLRQPLMLQANKLLMIGSTAAALGVLSQVFLAPSTPLPLFFWKGNCVLNLPLFAGCVASWWLNYNRRGHDMSNVGISFFVVCYMAAATN